MKQPLKRKPNSPAPSQPAAGNAGQGNPSSDSLKNADDFIKRGTQYFQEHKLEAALADFTCALELATDASTVFAALFNRGRVYGRMQTWNAAIADLDRACFIAPAFALTYVERGNCLSLRGEHRSAIIDYDRAIALLPRGEGRAMTHCNRAVSLDAIGDFSAALQELDRAQSLIPNNPRILNEQARIRERAKSASNPAEPSPVSQAPTASAQEYMERAWAATENGDLVDALVNFGRAIEIEPGNPNCYYGRGVANCQLRRYPQALQDLDRALQLTPQFPGALTERGICYVEMGNYARGMQDYDHAINVGSNYALAHINKGSLLARQEKWQQAHESLNRGIALGGTPDAYYNRAFVHEQLGEYQEAIEDWKTFLEFRSEGRQAEPISERIKDLEKRTR